MITKKELHHLDSKYFPYPWSNNAWDEIEVAIYPTLGRYQVFTKESNHQLIGYALFLVEDDTASLLKIIVIPHFRRKGIARDLLWQATRYLNLNIYLEVDTNNLAAISLYEHLGFVKINHISKFYSMGHDATIYLLKNYNK